MINIFDKPKVKAKANKNSYLEEVTMLDDVKSDFGKPEDLLLDSEESKHDPEVRVDQILNDHEEND